MGDSENADIVYDPLTDSVRSKRKRTWMRGAISTIRSTVQGRPSQEPDPELGVGGTPARAAAFQLGYPSLAKFPNSDDVFMIYRRFGFLHARFLFHQRERLERELDRDSDHWSFQEHRQSSAYSNYTVKLSEAIEKYLSTYSE